MPPSPSATARVVAGRRMLLPLLRGPARRVVASSQPQPQPQLEPRLVSTRAGRRRPLNTSSTAAVSPSLASAGAGGVPTAKAAGTAAEGGGDWSRKYKLAAYVLGPLVLPAGFVAALVYDDEFREDVDRRFPEIVDAVRRRVGFEEDQRRRRADLEKAFISSQPVGVTVQLQSGVRYSEQVSPLKTLEELYDALVGSSGGSAAGPIVALDFEDISGDEAAAVADDEPVTPGEADTQAPHPNDKLAVVPPPLRGVMASSLWDLLAPAGEGSGSGVKQGLAERNERQVQIDNLEASLRDIDEEVAILRQALRDGSSLRAIDEIQNDIAYLNARRRGVKRELRGLGLWWRW